MLSVPLSTSGLHYSRWPSGGIGQVLCTGAITLFCHLVHGFTEGFLSFSVTLVQVSCSRVCLLVVSRLLGQTLRHFAPVWCCHRDSLTRWRLANCARSRACSLFSQSSRLVPAHDDMCLVVSDTRKVSSRYVEIWRSCIHFSSFPCFLHSFRLYIRDTRGRARNVLHPGAFSESLCCDLFVHLRGYFQANAPFDQSLVVAVFCC